MMNPTNPPRDRVNVGRGAGWFLFLTIATVALAGFAPTTAPLDGAGPATNIGGMLDWIEGTGSGGAVMTLVWLTVVATVAYLWVVSIAVVIARRHGVSNTVLESVTPTLVKTILTGTATIGLVGAVPAAAVAPYLSGPATITSATSTFANTDFDQTRFDRTGFDATALDETALDETAPPIMTTGSPTADLDKPPVMSRRDSTNAGATIDDDPPIMSRHDAQPNNEQSNNEQPNDDEVNTWTVNPGDHLWSIAEHIVGQNLERPADEDEVADYWQDLIEANQQNLIDPDNPDLIQPGQVLTLPHYQATNN